MSGAEWSKLSTPMREERVRVPGGRVERVCEPASIDQVREVVSAAATTRTGLLLSAGRTRLALANRADSLGLGLSLRLLSGIDEFEPDEGVLHAKAGTPLVEIREVVLAEGWELPLDSPGEKTTVGGTIASAVTGPRAQAFGSVSDAILGLDVVNGGGVASKCGGRVVKNVTGYDLAKLYCGSYGSLAVVTGAWLRLRPASATCYAYRSEVSSNTESFESVRKLARLTSVRAMLWSEAPGASAGTLHVELGGSEEGVAHDRASLASILSLEEIATGEIDALREARAAVVDDSESSFVAVRARVPGSRVDEMRRSLLSAGLRLSLDPGLGVLYARGRLADVQALAAIRTQAEAAGGLATFEWLPDPWRTKLDVFGSLAGTESLVMSLKEKFDPSRILNPGRFVANQVGGDAS